MANVIRSVRMPIRQGTILSSQNVSFITKKRCISWVIESFSAEIENLKQNLYLVIETMRNTGVGALPILSLQPNSEDTPVPTEQQLLTNTTQSLQALYDKVQRSYDSASAVANLLSTDHIPRSGKWEGGGGWFRSSIRQAPSGFCYRHDCNNDLSSNYSSSSYELISLHVVVGSLREIYEPLTFAHQRLRALDTTIIHDCREKRTPQTFSAYKIC